MSCKSCFVCQNLFKQLQQHLTTVHILTGTEGVLGNVILNLLSLLVQEEAHDLNKQVHMNRTVPVISKPPDKQIKTSSNKDVVVSSFSGDFSANVLGTAQQELSSTLIPISVNEKVRENQLKMRTIPQNLIEFPLIPPPQSNDPQNDAAINSNLINNDGTLTPMGLLFLSNQSNSTPGKSDHDDVADILINKMSIPSLKGLESPNLQTFYLHQLALSQLQALTEGTNMAVDQNIANPSNLQKKHDSLPSSLMNTDKSFMSFENILERHRHINEMIVEMNMKTTKIDESSSSKQNIVSNQRFDQDPNVLTISSPGMPSAKPNISIKPNISQTMPSTSLLSKQRKEVLTASSNKKSIVPVLLTTGDSTSILTNQLSSPSSSSAKNLSIDGDNIDDDDTSEVEDVHFTKEKKDDAPINLQILQNIIVETSKRIQEGFPSLKLPDELSNQNINVAIGSSISKVPVTLEGLIIEPPSSSQFKQDTSSEEVKEENVEDKESRTYSADNNIFIKPLLYKCDKCGITFSVQQTLQAHIKTAHDDKVEFCNYCQMSFKTAEDYYIHVSSHHQGNENVYNCQYCDKVFTSSGDYKKHLSRHTHKRPYLCGHCSKSFRDPGSLAKHERIHTGEQPYICTVCSRGFAEKSSLRKHARVHSGEKPYKCDQCDKSFSISGNLQRHVLIHSGKRPFKCTICMKSFNNQSHLRRHIRNLHAKEDGKVEIVVPRNVSDDEEMKLDH